MSIPVSKLRNLSSTNLSNIIVDPAKKVLYIGQSGTSGYAVACKGYIYDLILNGCDVEWLPQVFDISLEGESFIDKICKQVKITTPKITGYDEIYFHTTPDLWPSFKSVYNETVKNTKIIGVSVWETSQLPNEWVNFINSTVHELIVPTNFNKHIYTSCGISVPIRVLPHFVFKEPLPKNYEIFDYKGRSVPKNKFTFYNISEYNERKGIDDLLKVFCSLYGNHKDYQLVLKTHYLNYDDKNINECIRKFTKQCNCKNVYLITKNLKKQEINALHSLGDVYVSLHKGEAYGLVLKEALNYNKKIITTGFGGHLDFLGKSYPYLVDYDLIKVNSNGFQDRYYNDNQFWAQPNLDHAKDIFNTITNE